MLHLSTVINTLLAPPPSWQQRLLREWSSIIGDLHQRMRLDRIVDQTIFVGVYEPHWMQELFLLSKMIIRSINTKLGDTYVQQIRFKAVGARSVRTTRLSLARNKSVRPAVPAEALCEGWECSRRKEVRSCAPCIEGSDRTGIDLSNQSCTHHEPDQQLLPISPRHRSALQKVKNLELRTTLERCLERFPRV